MSPAQLRAIAEIAVLTSFIGFQKLVLNRPLIWNHVVGFSFVLFGVLIVLGGPFNALVFRAGGGDTVMLRSGTSSHEQGSERELEGI